VKWPKKREFMAFYLLSRKFSGQEKEELALINEIREELCVTARTSKKIMKRLLSLRMIERKGEGKVRVLGIEEYLEQVYSAYKTERCAKFRKVGRKIGEK
jgi:hypothetical protein